MKAIVLNFLALCSLTATAQTKHYTTANAHSHNDYEQAAPFTAAYSQQFGSIEADIYLVAGSEKLWVAHTTQELSVKKQTLDSLYLRPLVEAIEKNKGSVYSDRKRKLQLMIDIKTEAVSTLDALIAAIQQYPVLTKTPTLTFVISGNRPAAEKFSNYPSWLKFDGVAGQVYPSAAMKKIVMISGPLQQFTKWKGDSPLPAADSIALKKVVDATHAHHKTIRFWAAPDNELAWRTLMNLHADFINTDRIDGVAKFLAKP